MVSDALLVNLAVALGAVSMAAPLLARLGPWAVLGCILAGVAIGFFMPGFVGDTPPVASLAGGGMILLLLAIGVRHSLGDFRRAGPVAIVGARSGSPSPSGWGRPWGCSSAGGGRGAARRLAPAGGAVLPGGAVELLQHRAQ
jgi:Kef-type K+ transport system membrane component KefB